MEVHQLLRSRVDCQVAQEKHIYVLLVDFIFRVQNFTLRDLNDHERLLGQLDDDVENESVWSSFVLLAFLLELVVVFEGLALLTNDLQLFPLFLQVLHQDTVFDIEVVDFGEVILLLVVVLSALVLSLVVNGHLDQVLVFDGDYLHLNEVVVHHLQDLFFDILKFAVLVFEKRDLEIEPDVLIVLQSIGVENQLWLSKGKVVAKGTHVYVEGWFGGPKHLAFVVVVNGQDGYDDYALGTQFNLLVVLGVNHYEVLFDEERVVRVEGEVFEYLVEKGKVIGEVLVSQGDLLEQHVFLAQYPLVVLLLKFNSLLFSLLTPLAWYLLFIYSLLLSFLQTKSLILIQVKLTYWYLFSLFLTLFLVP